MQMFGIGILKILLVGGVFAAVIVVVLIVVLVMAQPGGRDRRDR